MPFCCLVDIDTVGFCRRRLLQVLHFYSVRYFKALKLCAGTLAYDTTHVCHVCLYNKKSC